MARLRNPRLIYLKENDNFHYESRELPVYSGDELCTGKGEYYCISHKLFLWDIPLSQLKESDKKKCYEEHLAHQSTHKIVWYCFIHQRFEEV